MYIPTNDLKLKVAIQNDMHCGSAFFSLLKKFISKLETLCNESGVMSVANIELSENNAEGGRMLKTANFHVQLSNGRIIRIATSARTLDDAISNAFDECRSELMRLLENRA